MISLYHLIFQLRKISKFEPIESYFQRIIRGTKNIRQKRAEMKLSAVLEKC